MTPGTLTIIFDDFIFRQNTHYCYAIGNLIENDNYRRF